MKKMKRNMMKRILMPLLALAIMFTSVCSTSIDANAAKYKKITYKVKSSQIKKWKVTPKKISAKKVLGKDTANLAKWMYQLCVENNWIDEETGLGTFFRNYNADAVSNSTILSDKAKTSLKNAFSSASKRNAFKSKVYNKIYKQNKKGKIVSGVNIALTNVSAYLLAKNEYYVQEDVALYYTYTNKALKKWKTDCRVTFGANQREKNPTKKVYEVTVKKGKAVWLSDYFDSSVTVWHDGLTYSKLKKAQYLFSNKKIATVTKASVSTSDVDLKIKGLKEGTTMLVARSGKYLFATYIIHVV